MALWKTLLLVAVMAVSFFVARRYFDLVAIVAGLLWVAEYFRSRAERRGRRRKVSVGHFAVLLGLPARSQITSFKFRWSETLVRLSGVVEDDVTPVTKMITASSPLLKKVPFCFVARRTDLKVREAQLVENSRIPDIAFEYVLRRVDLPGPWEAASNMPELFEEAVRQLLELAPRARGESERRASASGYADGQWPASSTLKGLMACPKQARGTRGADDLSRVSSTGRKPTPAIICSTKEPTRAFQELFGGTGLEVQKVWCNGVALSSRFILEQRKPTREELSRFLDGHVFFHLTLTRIINNVDFKAPM